MMINEMGMNILAGVTLLLCAFVFYKIYKLPKKSKNTSLTTTLVKFFLDRLVEVQFFQQNIASLENEVSLVI